MKTNNILVGLLAAAVIVFGLRQMDSGRTDALKLQREPYDTTG